MNKTAVIDIGSNSVRMAVIADGKTLFKESETTRLSKNLHTAGVLEEESMIRTAEAVADFKNKAEREGCEVYAFATAAARKAGNREQFKKIMQEISGLDVDIISGEQEAIIGLAGALKGEAGAVLDIGGASTELSVTDGKDILFVKSIDVGTVRLKESCGEDEQALSEFIGKAISGFDGAVVTGPLYAIGGTATTVGKLAEKDFGGGISYLSARKLAAQLKMMTIEERILAGVKKGRADVVYGGCLLLCKIMEKLKVKEVFVSASDNLEGYYETYIDKKK